MLTLPDVRQSEAFDCGAAAAACICRFWKLRPGPVGELLGTNAIDGTDPRAVEAFFRGQGLRVLSGNMDLDTLRWLTGRGRPVLCLVTREGLGHYIVAAGLQRGRVYYHDPHGGPASCKAADFDASWVDFDRFGLVYRRFGIATWKEGE